jgi:hypothetical protein
LNLLNENLIKASDMRTFLLADIEIENDEMNKYAFYFEEMSFLQELSDSFRKFKHLLEDFLHQNKY